MSVQFNKLLLGSLIMRPALLESSDISDGDFPDEREVKIFRAIAEEWENSRPECIDINCLTAKVGDGQGAYLSGLLDGLVKLDDQTFGRYLREYRKRLAARRVARALKRELDLEQKTGEFDPEPIRGAWTTYDLLEAGGDSANVISLSQVNAEPIIWLWQGRLPRGMLSLLAGNPGTGKSFFCIALGSLLSRGEPLPDSQGPAPKCSSLFLVGEDPVAQAVRPRAEANGADLEKIFILSISFSGDYEVLVKNIRLALLQNKDIGLIVIDPLNAFMPSGVNWFHDPEVRRDFLSPLIDLAEKFQVAILGVVHLTKSADLQGLSRIPGSLAYGAAARSVLACGFHPDDEERHVLLSLKMNYARRPNALAFRINPDLRVTFETHAIEDLDVEAVLTRKPDDIEKKNFADRWLLSLLSAGPRDLREIEKEAKAAGIGHGTLHRSKIRLAIVSRSTGFGKFKAATWELPK